MLPRIRTATVGMLKRRIARINEISPAELELIWDPEGQPRILIDGRRMTVPATKGQLYQQLLKWEERIKAGGKV